MHKSINLFDPNSIKNLYQKTRLFSEISDRIFMPISHQLNDQQTISKYDNDGQDSPEITTKQKRKQDAFKLAELIYDIFHRTLSSVIMDDDSRKDNKYVE